MSNIFFGNPNNSTKFIENPTIDKNISFSILDSEKYLIFLSIKSSLIISG